MFHTTQTIIKYVKTAFDKFVFIAEYIAMRTVYLLFLSDYKELPTHPHEYYHESRSSR